PASTAQLRRGCRRPAPTPTARCGAPPPKVGRRDTELSTEPAERQLPRPAAKRRHPPAAAAPLARPPTNRPAGRRSRRVAQAAAAGVRLCGGRLIAIAYAAPVGAETRMTKPF